jgi:Zn ribbon nucleic-acid-binding protein
MVEFTPDPAFMQRAVLAIRHLEHLVTTLPRAEHRLDQIVIDLEAVGKRYVRGAKCFTCEASTKLPVIQHTTFCSEDCRRHDAERESIVETRIREAIAEHVQPEAQL